VLSGIPNSVRNCGKEPRVCQTTTKIAFEFVEVTVSCDCRQSGHCASSGSACTGGDGSVDPSQCSGMAQIRCGPPACLSQLGATIPTKRGTTCCSTSRRYRQLRRSARLAQGIRTTISSPGPAPEGATQAPAVHSTPAPDSMTLNRAVILRSLSDNLRGAKKGSKRGSSSVQFSRGSTLPRTVEAVRFV